MKKYIYSAIAMLALAACSSEESRVDMSGNRQVRLELTAEVDGGVTTRANSGTLQQQHIASGKKVGFTLYEASDKTSTHNATSKTNFDTGKSNQSFTANGTGGWSATPDGYSSWYWPVDGCGIYVYAIAPYQSSWNMTSDANTFTVQADQSSDDNYIASDLMAGEPTTNPVARTVYTGTWTQNVGVVFKHKLAKIYVTLQGGAGLNGTGINGLAASRVTSIEVLNTNKTATVTTDKGKITGVAVKNGTTGDIIASKLSLTASACIIPQTVNKDTQFFRITTTDGGVFVYPLPANVTFEPAKQYNYTITLTLYGLTVSSSVTDWTLGFASTQTGSIYNNK